MNDLQYKRYDGFLVPDLTLPEQQPVGKYGLLRLQYLKETDPAKVDLMRLTEELNPHLAEMDRQAREQVEAAMESLTRQSPPPDKATDPMGWTRHMNRLKAQAEESVIPGLVMGG